MSRLLDVLSLTAADRRVQTVFTHDGGRRSALAGDVEGALRNLGVLFAPWDEARDTPFDLAVAASENDRLAELDAPVLLLPHGAGHLKFYPGTSAVSGLNPERLVVDGRVVPAAIALAHPDQLSQLREVCPPAAPYGVVVGDPALARMRDSEFRTQNLRAAFGARDKHVVVVASTFGPESVLGRCPDLPERLVACLPADEYQVVVVLHPGVWAAHGPWQVRAWLSGAASRGVHVLGPSEGWQAALLAASVVISDHGSLGVYAAALNKPVLLAGRGSSVTVPGSAAAILAAGAPLWDPEDDPRRQVDAALLGHDEALVDRVTSLLVEPSLDGAAAARRLRSVVYRLLRLAEPEAPASFGVVSAPAVGRSPVPAWVVGADVRPDGVRVERFPELGAGDPHDGLSYRHLVSDLRTAGIVQMASADVVIDDGITAGTVRRWASRAPGLLRRWPRAKVVAAVVDGQACAVWAGDDVLVLSASEPVDLVVLASVAYARLAATGQVLGADRLHLGDRAIAVTVEAG